MSQIVTATFENGLLKPDTPLDLPAGSKVRLIILEPAPRDLEDEKKAWEELERLLDEASVDSGGDILTRDQLHERR